MADNLWRCFLPFMFVVGLFIVIKSNFIIKKRTTTKVEFKLKNIVGPISISLGGMIGTGAIIGVLGALSKYSVSGEVNIEAMVLWALIGACIMVPVSYSETMISKIMGKNPREYISELLSPVLGKIYAICFVTLYVFGFGGFQFSGIESVLTMITDRATGIDLPTFQRYLFIVLPVIIIVMVIVLSKKNDVFMKAMTSMIGIAIVSYFMFFIFFVVKTNEYIPMYINKILKGFLNPVNGFSGITLGIILGIQKVMQTSETGLGASAMAAQESKTKPREAAIIAIIPTIITIFVSIVITSYITSFGIEKGLIKFPADAMDRLYQYFNTAQSVTGNIGLIVLCTFTLLSALTTILGSFYYLNKLFKERKLAFRIIMYMMLILLAGTLAVFGDNVIFEAVDLLLFLLCGINMLALGTFCINKWKKYRIDVDEEDNLRKAG